MRSRTTFLLGSFALAALTSTAMAQKESRPRTGGMAPAPSAAPAAPQTRPAPGVRIGGIAPPPPAAQPASIPTTGLPELSNINYGPAPVIGSGIGRQVVVSQITYFPTVVLSDGRVFANFGTGRGYEQVLRQCAFTGTIPAGVYMAPCWTVDAAGRYAVIQQR